VTSLILLRDGSEMSVSGCSAVLWSAGGDLL
jgi:hypothetical protein